MEHFAIMLDGNWFKVERGFLIHAEPCKDRIVHEAFCHRSHTDPVDFFPISNKGPFINDVGNWKG